MNDLSNFTDEELKQELEERQKRIIDDMQKFIIANVDWMLLAVPEHSRTSCKDGDRVNSYRARCTRCFLLEFKRKGWLDCEATDIPHWNPAYITFTIKDE